MTNFKEESYRNTTGFSRIENILKSPADTRQYRGLKLQNELKVILISDPKTDMSAAALEVGVGFMYDPKHIPGLAHFLEHMLFMGTEKYPVENDFEMYLSEGGGIYNAMTSINFTRFYFDIAPKKLDGALDRFAQFFVAPIFSQSAVKREINAVNSEYEGEFFDDYIRSSAVFSDVIDPDHPLSHFGCGNTITLEENPIKMGTNIHIELLKFYETWYSSNIMSLAVLGIDSLDELEEMVTEKFSKIKNRNVFQPNWSKKLFLDRDNSIKILITPISDIRTLSIGFVTSDIHMHYKSSPDTYIADLINYGGKNSIMSELRAKGWALSLYSSFDVIPRGFSIYEIEFILTEDGFNNIIGIVTLIFQFIKMLKAEEPKKWIFDDESQLREISFRFQRKKDALELVNSLTHRLQLYPFEDILSLYVPTEWRPDLIKNLLSELTPRNCWLIIMGKKLEPLSTIVEPWYNVKYGKEKISPETIKGWENCGLNEKFKIPPPNQFIPTDFQIVRNENENEYSNIYPEIIYDNDLMRIWYKHDIEFLEPRMYMAFKFLNPTINNDPVHNVMAIMLTIMFDDYKEEDIYDIDRAGFYLEVYAAKDGIGISIGGYSDKQERILEYVLNNFLTFTINKRIFENMKDFFIKYLESMKSISSIGLAFTNLDLILSEMEWSAEEYLASIPMITVDRIENFMSNYLSRVNVEGFIFGNLNETRALKLSELIKKKLEEKKPCPILSSALLLTRQHKLNSGDNYVYEIITNFQRNSCVLVYYQCKYATDTTTVLIELINQIIKEPLFNILRTKEQLGYLVFSAVRIESGSTGLLIGVESTKHPAFVEERIERFLKNILVRIQSLSDEDFQAYKDAVITSKLRYPKRLSNKFIGYYSEISSGEFHFDRTWNEIDIIEKLDKEKFINYFKNNFFICRRSLSIHVLSTVDLENTKQNDFDYKRQLQVIERFQDTKEKVVNAKLLKTTKVLYPCPKSFLHVKFNGTSHQF